MTEYEKAMMELKNAFGAESMWNLPLQPIMTPEEEAAYRANNFINADEIRQSLAEEEAAKKAAQEGLGLFGAMPSSGSGDNYEGRNYYVEREAQLRAEGYPEDKVQEMLRAEQEANNAPLAAGLNLFANAFAPGVGLSNAFKYGQALPDYLQGNLRTMIGDSSGYQSPFTPKAAGVAAPVVSGQSSYNTISPLAQMARDILAREAGNRAMSEISRTYGGYNTRGYGNYLTSYGPSVSTSGMSPETRAGLEAAQESFGYGTNADYYGD